jgi:hypothetical protein
MHELLFAPLTIGTMTLKSRIMTARPLQSPPTRWCWRSALRNFLTGTDDP